MAYRQIHTKIWKDAWFLDLAPDGKLLFFYLCTNERTNILGLYDLPLKVIAFETDLPPDTITAQLTSFQQAGKVEYENGWVWVKNLMRYNAQNFGSTDVQKHIRKTLASLPDGRLKTACAEYNTIPTPSLDPVETIPPPVIQEQEQEQELNQAEQDKKSGAIAPARPRTRQARQKPEKPTTKEQHPAVEVYREEAHLLPSDAWRKDIALTVGVDPPNLEFWRQVVHAWIGCGWV